MPCYCDLIRELENDDAVLESIIRDLEYLSSDFKREFTNRNTQIVDFFSPKGGEFFFNVILLGDLVNHVDAYEKELPQDFERMINDIGTSLSGMRRDLSQYRSADRKHHAAEAAAASGSGGQG
jgi:hypothetical protein